ncbi:arginase family protein, partial [Staphylococcus warneri]|uniref:arginase family protein n=1 Tax=Staphylococcus warneri TaxID=1292 RepID=UPI0034D9555A
MTLSNPLTQKLQQTILNHTFPLLLAPHHSIPVGSISPITKHYQNLPLISYHPHPHFNIPQHSPSQNIHGMPL